MSRKKAVMTAICLLLGAAFLYSLIIIVSRYVSKGSDISVHIERALAGNGYSLNSIFYRILGVFNDPRVNTAYIVLVVSASVIILAFRLRTYAYEQMDTVLPFWATGLFSFSLLFIATIYLPVVFPYFYRNGANPNLSPLVTQPLHSDTYHLMRLFAIPAFFTFVRLERTYRSRIGAGAAVCFTIWLLLANWAKPSFFMCFAPVVGLMLLLDCVRDKGKTIFQQIKFGLCVAVSAPIILLQFEKLFGVSTGNGISFTLSRITSGSLTEWIWLIVSSLTVPAAATAVLKKHQLTDRHVWICWAMFAVSLFWRFFFCETGDRASQNNFAWCTMICSFFLFCILFIKVICGAKKGQVPVRATVLLGAGYLAHLLCGLIYYIRLFGGGNLKM